MRALRSLLIVCCALCSAACTQLAYYTQALQGHMAIVHAARPIDAWLQDPGTSEKLKARLQLAQTIRAYAVTDLGLPDNGSYRSYAELDRPYVLWNVVATPELSLQAVRWCFPVAGCVSYRGYYHLEQAQQFARDLQGQGYDVRLDPVPAYSTLGWMNDPLLSTFIYSSDAYLARLIFHELAHQVVYVKGDTAFNEAFATMVEQVGVGRWLQSHGDAAERERYLANEQKSQQFRQLLSATRAQLEQVYAQPVSDDDKRRSKKEILANLRNAYQKLTMNWSGGANFDRWFEQPVNNANFVSVANYFDLVPAFQHLYELQGHSFPAFYRAVRQLASEDADTRKLQLALLGNTNPGGEGQTR
jgi:predicted aminopeptidase